MLNVLIDNGTDKYNFIKDLNCYPRSFTIGTAEPKTNYVDVPYRDGSLDMSEAISPIRYKSRQITIPMRIVHDEPLFIYDQISNAFSGKVCKIRILDKYDGYDDYYYEGRITIEALETSKSAWDFDLFMLAHPYKMREVTFNLESPTELNFYNSGIDVIPVITTSALITGTWNGEAFTLQAGTYEPVELKVKHGSNVIITNGTADFHISYLNKRL